MATTPSTIVDRRPGRAASKQAIFAGIVSGIIAGILMIVAHILYVGLATPMEYALPLESIAATWYGPVALLGGADVVFVGLLTHLVVAAVWGLIFGLIVGRFTHLGLAFGLGLLYGVIVWLVMTFAVMPAVDPTMSARVALLPGWWWFLVHLIFGAGFVFTPPLARAFDRSGRRRRARPEREFAVTEPVPVVREPVASEPVVAGPVPR